MRKLETAAIIGACAAAGGIAGATLRRRRGADLSGRVVLITGGSRGLGLALAREFARRGCRLAICSRSQSEREAAVRDLEQRGSVLALDCDVTRRSEVEQVIARVIDHYGAIDILVNNAGEIQVGPVESMTLRDFENAMDVMFWGAAYPTLALLPHLLRRNSGTIVNITSIGGKVAVPHLLPYACAKFAAVGLSEGLRAELAGTGVKVTTIVPGLMRTGSFLNAAFKGDVEREAAWFGVSSSMPGITINANRAARQIVEAARRGEAHRILTVAAKVLALAHGLFPGAVADALGWINRFALPAAGEGREVRGYETQVLRSRPMTVATALGRRAAAELNEMEVAAPVES